MIAKGISENIKPLSSGRSLNDISLGEILAAKERQSLSDKQRIINELVMALQLILSDDGTMLCPSVIEKAHIAIKNSVQH